MAINNEPTIQPRTVTGIFTNYIAKVLPLAFDESMSYYECLCALLKYINDTIVPDINNTNEGLGELQEFYEELQSYVNNYFDNLDVQVEINNKLDDMAESGELADVLEPIIDEYTTIPELTQRVEALENAPQTEMVVIGDSFSSRAYLTTPNKLWWEIVAENLGLTAHNYADPGSGFLVQGDTSHKTFSEQITQSYNDTSFDKDNVKYVFIYGGTNDLRYSNDTEKNNWRTAYNTTFSNARTCYPKSKIIYLGSSLIWSFYNKNMVDSETISELWVDNEIKQSDAFKTYNIISVDMTCFMLGVDRYFTDGVAGHPNGRAHIDLANTILNGLITGTGTFNHCVIASATLQSTSSSYATLSNTVSGFNRWYVRVTDHDMRLYLTTCLTASTRQNSYSFKTPFNLVIPYISLSPQTQKFQMGSVIVYDGTHSTNNVVSQNTLLYDTDMGRANLVVYPVLNDTTNNMYDIYIEYTINY